MSDERRIISRSLIATHGLVTAGSATAVTLIAANIARNVVIISNDSNQDVWIRFKTAATDNTKHGILLKSGDPAYQMGDGTVYIGEISIIFDIGANNDVSFIEY